MNNTNGTLATKPGTSTLVRAKFGPGMLLQHEDLEQLNLYTRDLSRLMFQSLFGCGVICGLVVGTKEDCGKVNVTVGAGVALACSGDPVYVPKEESFPIDENCDPDLPSPLWVVLCGTVKCCAPRTAICSPDDDDAHAECTRERDGYEIRVVSEPPPCVCGCPQSDDPNYRPPDETPCLCVDPQLKCYQDHYAGKCGCNCDECSDCDCKCILLARLKKNALTGNWESDHRFRRFIRPVLMRDPQVAEEQKPKVIPKTTGAQTLRRSVEQAAQDAAVQTVRKAAEEAAHEAAGKAAKDIATLVGQQAAEQVVRQVVEQVALEAARKAVQQAAEEAAGPAAEPAGPEVSQPEAMQAEESDASVKKPEKTTKSSKIIKSGLNKL